MKFLLLLCFLFLLSVNVFSIEITAWNPPGSYESCSVVATDGTAPYVYTITSVYPADAITITSGGVVSWVAPATNFEAEASGLVTDAVLATKTFKLKRARFLVDNVFEIGGFLIVE